MNYYWTCPHCGANLDPGESCDCKDEKNKETDPPERVRSPGYHRNDTTPDAGLSRQKGGNKMEIKQLQLENFQGLRDITLDFNGQSVCIYGNNATGKTTVFNALTWLLYGRASTGSTGFTPKTRGTDGELHHLNHSVCAEFLTGSGRVITLQKTFREVYKKKRGSAKEEFSGHTIDYFVDGVPVKEKDFNSDVLSLCGGDAEKVKILTAPDYFAEKMPWETRRKILLDVCGNISDADVIAASPVLKEFPDFLRIPGTGELYEIDQYRKIAAGQQAKINRELEGIPARIDEAEKAIPDLTGIDRDAVDRNIAALQERIADLTAQRAAAVSGDAEELRVREAVSNLRVQLAEGRARHIRKQSDRNAAVDAAILEAQSQAAAFRRNKESAEVALQLEEEKRNRLAQRREEIRTEYKTIFAERWNPENENCPVCGQQLPAERVQQMQSDFNLRRSNRLMETEQRGQREASKSMIAECDRNIDILKYTVSDAESGLAEAEKRIRELQEKRIPELPYESTPEYESLTRQIREWSENRTGSSSEAVSALDGQIRDANTTLQREQENRSSLEVECQQRKRIAELEAREKELSALYEHMEKGISLCDEFTRAKVSMLTENINKKFRRVSFRLFTDQINGGVKEGCDVLVPDGNGAMIPYQDANNAARINAGLEIIDTLSAAWNLTMPVFVDNAEGIQTAEKIHAQLIQLVVPPSWDRLGDMVRDVLIREYGSPDIAKAAYEARNNRLRVEVTPDVD